MARGELMGFNGCLGYDYNPEDKSISVNPAEAETVRLIFDLYIQGYGANTIAKRLTELGKVNKRVLSSGQTVVSEELSRTRSTRVIC